MVRLATPPRRAGLYDAGLPRLDYRTRRSGPPDCPAVPHVIEQLLHHVGAHRIVRDQEAAAEMQSERLPAVEVEHDRAGIAPQRRAVVPEKCFFHARHTARRQPFFVVDLTVDALHQVGFGDTAVVGRIADRRDLLRRRDGGREIDPRGEPRVARDHLDLEEGDVGSRRLFDMQRSDELENELLGIVDLLKKVDVAAHLPAKAHLKVKTVAFSLSELARHMAVGDDDVLRDEPAGADPIELGAHQIDAAHRRDRDVEQGPGFGQPLAPDFAVGLVDELQPGDVVADR